MSHLWLRVGPTSERVEQLSIQELATASGSALAPACTWSVSLAIDGLAGRLDRRPIVHRAVSSGAASHPPSYQQ